MLLHLAEVWCWEPQQSGAAEDSLRCDWLRRGSTAGFISDRGAAGRADAARDLGGAAIASHQPILTPIVDDDLSAKAEGSPMGDTLTMRGPFQSPQGQGRTKREFKKGVTCETFCLTITCYSRGCRGDGDGG